MRPQGARRRDDVQRDLLPQPQAGADADANEPAGLHLRRGYRLDVDAGGRIGDEHESDHDHPGELSHPPFYDGGGVRGPAFQAGSGPPSGGPEPRGLM